jgi:hypothetical protein
MHRTFFTTALCLLASAAFAQDAKPAGDKPAEKITYDQHVLPLLREKCGACHNANDKKGDLVLDNFGAAMRGGASGEVIRTDGDADKSYLYQVVAHQSEPFMPPNQPKLADEQLALLKKWIEGGALENAGSTSKVKKTSQVAKVEFSGERPAGPPAMPENPMLDPLVVSARGNGATALAANPWSPLIAVSGHKQVLLYHTGTLDLEAVLPFPEGQAHALRFSRNGQLLLAAGGRGAQLGKAIVFDVKTGERVAEVGSEYDLVLAADISPDQSMVALGGPKKVVRCYSIATGELIYEKTKHTDWITALEFSPDGVLLATGDRSNGLIVWEADTGREFYVLTGHTQPITDVTWAPDSNTLASSSEDAAVKFWEMQNGTQAKTFGAHGGGTTAARFARDGRLVTFGRDRQAKLWDRAGNAQRSLAAVADVGTEVVLCCETDRVFVADLTGTITVFAAKDGAKVGELTTNPPPLVTRIDEAKKTLASLEAAATDASAKLTALKKSLADRKAPADAAQKAASEAAAAVEPLVQQKAAAESVLAAKDKSFQTAEANIQSAEAARTKAIAERDAVVKAVADASAAWKSAGEAAAAAEAALSAAQQQAEANPTDAVARKAAADAAKAAAAALSALVPATQKKVDALAPLASKNDAVISAAATALFARTARDQAASEKSSAEKLVADVSSQLKAAQELAAAKKTEADKLAAAAQATEAEQKQLAALEAAAKSTGEVLAAAKAKLQRLEAARSRAPQTTAAK